MRRRFGPPVRLEVERSIDPYVLELLVRELGISDEEVFSLPGPLDLTGLWTIVGLDREDLKEATFLPKTSPQLSEVETAAPPDVLEAMRDHDVLLHHPYDSFSTSVQRFLEQAAADPKVLAIKQTLYRTSGDSPIVDALIDAAQAGKQVLALVEIKARFDERANISWARKLERQGVHVVYGLVGLKTHCKLSMVVRDDGERLRRYVHIGTGNYHPKTARLYEDMGLLTTDPAVGEDVSNVFNVLSGYSMNTTYKRLLVAPHSIRTGLVERIEREVAHHRAGRPARVRFKCNSIVDEGIIDALYRASQAGVPVDIWVRGICAVRPGVPGLSDNIRVHSVLGRFLEHSRAYEFANGGDTETWIGSADLMHRNLDRRVEVLVRLGAEHAAQVSTLIDMGFDDATKAWIGQPDGRWTPHITDADGAPCRDLQEHLIEVRSARSRRTPDGLRPVHLRVSCCAPRSTDPHHRKADVSESSTTDRAVERTLRVHALFRMPDLVGLVPGLAGTHRRHRDRAGRPSTRRAGARRLPRHRGPAPDPLGSHCCAAAPAARMRAGTSRCPSRAPRRAPTTRCACPWTPASPGRSRTAMADVVTALARRNPLVPVATLHTQRTTLRPATTPTTWPSPSSSTTSCRSWTATSWPAGSASCRSRSLGRTRPPSTRSSTC